MHGVSPRDRIRNKVIRQRTKVIDIGYRIIKLKWQRTGRSRSRRTENRGDTQVLEWRPLGTLGRTLARWSDDLRRMAVKS